MGDAAVHIDQKTPPVSARIIQEPVNHVFPKGEVVIRPGVQPAQKITLGNNQAEEQFSTMCGDTPRAALRILDP
ncbi:MAG: hypothetical protein C7B46_17975 [Sulfobacillus benefaciens]|uniref:Uncharacterized protein n=1 Tax=Sulfobacillus benefaciens TaxID=453960 RepID=A0A2T2X7H7_9FIRM|nr:MAG: hypothetical protein C7B46_17975 [Sulfobacillus benefaciens]